jgi:cysteine-rich repeat protein
MKTLTSSLAMALSLALVTSAGAQDKCGALKMKASGKKAAGLATCYAKGLAHGDLSFVPTCTAAVSLKFGAAFDKAEAKFGPACLTHDDKGDVEDAIDICTTAIFDALRHKCGDGVIQGDEACDDGDIANGDGCSGVCTIEHGFYCDNSPPPSSRAAATPSSPAARAATTATPSRATDAMRRAPSSTASRASAHPRPAPPPAAMA